VHGYGHDGQQFYVVARSVTDLQQIDGNVDRPRYRARRILFPLLASAFLAGAPTVWAMFAISLLSVGMAAVAAGRLARRVGGPVWLGLAVALTSALLIGVRASLGDALAFSLALWGVVLWRRHLGWAVLLFALAARTRETTLVVPAACFLLAPAASGWRSSSRSPSTEPGRSPSASSSTTTCRRSRPVPSPTRSASSPRPSRPGATSASTPPRCLLALVLTVASLVSAWVLCRRLPEVALSGCWPTRSS
jgi:hypothetical protein